MRLPFRLLLVSASLTVFPHLAFSSQDSAEPPSATTKPATYHPSFKSLPYGHDTALLIADAQSGAILFSQREEQFQPPASTQKMVTALAAQLYLGKDYRFTTQLEQQGNNVILRFSGDPALSRTQLASLLGKLKAHSGSTIKGDLLLNGSQFSGYEQAPGWPWDILGVCYSAPSSSLSLEHNCVQGALYSNRNVGDTTRVNIPSHQPLKVTTDARVTTKERQKTSHCDLELTDKGSNHYHLSGCLVKRDKPLPLNFAVQDTKAYISQVIKAELKRLGIKLEGSITRDDSAKGKVIASHRSAPLHELLDTMVKDSDNLYADNIAKTIGAKYFKQPGSFANGSKAIKAILKDKANIDLDQAVIVDGSGLSRNNRMTASQMMTVITYLYNHDDTLNLLATLPVSGQSGTLRYRQSIRHKPLQGKIHAKSGSLYGTYNLAGLIKTQSGQTLLFVQMVSNYFPPERDESLPVISPPIETFERALYQGLYQQY
ncbi:serine-type D-Ala-D-Ala carboxypeptidase [Photobacterium rosenbergii]|uniref:Serine-type D-Ala-D-Ala carboxypeptidase n=1 Tax=Photobacterium rosenbergii TaxID=294936 RepID=A0ABU3ZQ44_9GAMM|nr:serine-type D-Ala-D-Ala carboxypeptidase [Photobacterium rosenbergii]MDV5172200.1 serine-type D-Ala-D-Ala carboxypeptidase [Photobacterium rosenbergii]